MELLELEIHGLSGQLLEKSVEVKTRAVCRKDVIKGVHHLFQTLLVGGSADDVRGDLAADRDCLILGFISGSQ